MQRLTISALLLLGLALLASCSSDFTTATTSTSAAATATATKGAAEPAVLGAMKAAFIAKYEQPNDHSDSSSLHFNRYPGSNVDALIVNFVTVGPGSGRADSVLGQASDQAPDQGWSMATARTTCAPYRPADSKAGKQVSVSNSSGAVVGEDDIYTSATLAPQFDASAFTDAEGDTVAAGTFDVFYLYKTTNDPSHIDSCSLFLGSSQTTA